MTFGDITANFTALLNRRDATSTQIAAWLQNGIQKVQRELRCPAMEKIITVPVDNTYSSGITIPTDLLELQYLLNSQGERITKEDITRVSQLAFGLASPGVSPTVNIDFPRFYVRTGVKWLLGPTPGIGDRITVAYYADIPTMTQPGDQCTLSQIAGDMFTYAALVYAGDFYSDRRSDKWEARYEQIKADLQGMADADELSGGSEVSPAFDYPDDHQDDF